MIGAKAMGKILLSEMPWILTTLFEFGELLWKIDDG